MSMSMPPVRPQVRTCDAMLAVDAPEDHSLQGVSVAGRAPELPGRAAGTVSTPVHGLTAPSCRNLQTCPPISHQDTASPVPGAGPWLTLACMCVPCITPLIPHDCHAFPDHCKPLFKPNGYRRGRQAVHSSPALLLVGPLLAGFAL